MKMRLKFSNNFNKIKNVKMENKRKTKKLEKKMKIRFYNLRLAITLSGNKVNAATK